MSVITDDYISPDPESFLAPGEALLNCNGQDIVKKGASKGRNRILTIMPMHLAMPVKASDTTLGAIRNLNSDQPELVISSIDGDYVFKGRFEAPSTKFLAIACQPSTSKKTGQSTMTDVFDRILVFGKPVLIPTKTRSQEVDSQAEDLPGVYSCHHGTSAVADPIRPATAKRLGGSPSAALSRTSSATKGLGRSISLNSVGRSQASSKGSASKVRQRYDSDASTADGSSIGDSSSDSEHSAIVVDEDSASDVAEELGATGGDSPVLARTSSRRASATKPVSYRESDGEEEDERSYSSSSSSSGSSEDSNAHSDSAGSDANIGTAKGTAKGRTPTAKSSSSAKSPARSAAKPRASATKAPVARKLAAPRSTAKGKATKKASGYFSEGSDSDGATADGDGNSQQSSPFTSDAERASGDDDSGDEYEEPVSGSKKRKPSGASRVASPTKKGPTKAPAKPVAKTSQATAAKGPGGSSSNKPKAAASKGAGAAVARASAAKRPARAAPNGKGRRVISLDSDSEGVSGSSDGSGSASDSDEDYED